MSFCLRSWLTGFALGLSGKPYPYSKREPTAYLYNGVRLPALPEWDRGVYPYAVVCRKIVQETPVAYRLYLITVPPVNRVSSGTVFGGKTGMFKVTLENSNIWGVWDTETGDIVESDFIEVTEDNTTAIYDDSFFEVGWGAIWSNTDIFGTDGSVLIAASEPVPVYE